MKKLIVFCTACILTAACNSGASKNVPLIANADTGQPASPAPGDSEWISLFDGKSLNEWHTYGKKTAGAAWNIDSGSIHLKPGIKNGYQTVGGGDLVSNDTFSHFTLQLEWKIAKKANSGIMIYVQDDTVKFKETWNTGPEIQVCDPDSNEDAHSHTHEAGDLYDLMASTTMSAKPAMQWNQVEITSRQGHLDIYLNSIHIISTVLWDEQWKKRVAASKFSTMPGFGSFHSGHFALQDHGEEVWYRNIRVKKW